MERLRRMGKLFRLRREAAPEWPDDGSWIPAIRSCTEFKLDAGYAVTSCVPGWMLPVGVPDCPPVPLPDLPQVAGHVLAANAVGREAELIRYFSRLPQLPDRASWREITEFSSLPVNLLLSLPGEDPIVADMFAGSRRAADSLLDDLSNVEGAGGTVYDNLDQGWALRIMVRADAVLVLDWNPEAADPRESARVLQLPRSAVAVQAIAARHRLDHLHAVMLHTLGRNLWSCPDQH